SAVFLLSSLLVHPAEYLLPGGGFERPYTPGRTILCHPGSNAAHARCSSQVSIGQALMERGAHRHAASLPHWTHTRSSGRREIAGLGFPACPSPEPCWA